MILVKETTVWNSVGQPNHTYLMADDMSKMHGYFKNNTKEFQMFKTPIRLDKRYRTFKILQKGLTCK